MQKKSILKTGIAAALMLAFGMGAVQAQAQEVVRLGNLKFEIGRASCRERV